MGKTKIKAPIPIPFRKDGSLLGYSELKYPEIMTPTPGGWEPYAQPHSWRDNFVFTDTIIYKSISCGRSAVNPIFISETTGARYQTFLSEFDAMMPFIIKGKITADFTFVKKGSNYGLSLVPDSAKLPLIN